jgi:hypothetical protein
MSFYTWFDWFKKLRSFVNEQNLKIDVVLKASQPFRTIQVCVSCQIQYELIQIF